MYKINGYASAIAMLLHEVGSQVAKASTHASSLSNSSSAFRTPSKSGGSSSPDQQPIPRPTSPTFPSATRLHAKMRDYHSSLLSFSKRLLETSFNATPVMNNILLCTCCRAAFTNLAALLSLGGKFNKRDVGVFFGLWQTSVQHAKKGRKNFEVRLPEWLLAPLPVPSLSLTRPFLLVASLATSACP